MNSNEKIGKLETVGVVLRPDTPQLKEYFLDFKKFLATKNIKALLDKRSAKMVGLQGTDFYEMCKLSDLIISIGGDGTLISATRRSIDYQKPILGVNMGKLGFLTDYKADEINAAIEAILADDYRIDLRMVMEIEAMLSGYKGQFRVINDLVIRHKKAKMVHIKLFIDGVLINNYYGDGLIISTPTGATGYNLSAGGPIVFPYAKNFIFTPICPHSLTQRPLVLPVNFDVRLSVDDDDCMALLDGQDSFTLNSHDEVKISMSESGAKMIHHKDRNFFTVISDKLSWGH
jgi:NAD+ kinase